MDLRTWRVPGSDLRARLLTRSQIGAKLDRLVEKLNDLRKWTKLDDKLMDLRAWGVPGSDLRAWLTHSRIRTNCFMNL